MEKILFISRYFVGKSRDHLSQKFENQVNSLRNIGYMVDYIGIEDNKIYLFQESQKRNIGNYSKCKIPYISNYLKYKSIYKSLLRCNVLDDYSYAYLRSIFPIKSGLALLNKIRISHIKIIMEIPTYPPKNEYDTEKNFIKKTLLNISLKKSKNISKYVDLFTLIGEKSNSFYGAPALNISNGIDISKISLKQPTEFIDQINILALASMARWHGYDRIIFGLKNYVTNTHNIKIYIYFIGPDGDGTLEYLKKLSKELGLLEYISFVGPQYGEDLEKYFNICHFGVASLGLHRINIYNTSILKIREYTSRGLPFIYATNDELLKGNEEFAIKVPSCDDPIDFNKIINQMSKVVSNKNLPNIMRKFAYENMTWEIQFKKIFEHINSNN